jgi:hypothetical protein
MSGPKHFLYLYYTCHEKTPSLRSLHGILRIYFGLILQKFRDFPVIILMLHNLLLHMYKHAIWGQFITQEMFLKIVDHVSIPGQNCSHKQKTPLPESTRELYRLSDNCLSAKLVQTFTDRGMLRSQRGKSPTVVISVFYTGSATFSFKLLLSWAHEVEWTPFQTH